MKKLVSAYKFHFLIIITSFFALTKFHFDTDLGIHLAYGGWFLDKGQVLRTDPFTWTMSGFIWEHSYFLYQLLTAFLFRQIGFSPTVFIFGIIPVLAILAMMPKKIGLQAGLPIILGVMMASLFAGIRPHIIDFSLFGLVLVFLERRYYEKRLFIPFWFFLFLVWVNLHGGFLVGFLAFAGVAIVDSLDRKMKKEKIHALTAGFSILAAWAGTLITPFGFNIGRSLSDYINLDVWLKIQEFQPVIFFPNINLVFALSGLIFIYLIRKTKLGSQFSWFSLGFVLFFLPFIFVFMLTFWAAYFIFVSVRYFEIHFDFKWNFSKLAPVVLAGTMIPAIFVVGFLASFKPYDQIISTNYPVDALNFMTENGLEKGVFNDLGWGGFILWKYPNIKVFIDGRDGWKTADGKTHLGEYIALLEGNCELLEKYDVETVLVKPDFKNDCFMSWEEVYGDSMSKVMVKP